MNFDDHVAARTLYGEARGEGPDGLDAVSHVLKNRVAKPNRFGRTVAAVCLANMQFSCWNLNDPNRRVLLELAADDATLKDCMSAWLRASSTDDPTGGATHYKVVGTSARWAENVTPNVTIGHHEFYCVD